MKEDVYGSQMQHLMEEATEPLGASDLQSATDASQARVYAWISKRRQAGDLLPAGKNPKGGRTYVWRTHPELSNGHRVETSEAIEVGQVWTIAAILLRTDGEPVLEWESEDGTTIRTRLDR